MSSSGFSVFRRKYRGQAVDMCAAFRQSPSKETLPRGMIAVTPVIYKIVPETLWEEARQSGVFNGAAIDLADGFIHFSTAGQAKETAARHFAGQQALLLVAVDAAALGEKLVFEPSRGGALFPHLYSPLPTSAVLWEKPLTIGPDGTHMFPEMAE
jgi:uncharacterized protein (DUF952 family)